MSPVVHEASLQNARVSPQSTVKTETKTATKAAPNRQETLEAIVRDSKTAPRQYLDEVVVLHGGE